MDLLVCHKNSSRLWVFLVSFSFVFFPSLLISQLNIVFLHIGVDLLPFLGELLVKALDEFSHLVSVKANSKKVESEALSLSPVAHKSWQDFLHSSLHEDPTNHSGNSRHVKIEVNGHIFTKLWIMDLKHFLSASTPSRVSMTMLCSLKSCWNGAV